RGVTRRRAASLDAGSDRIGGTAIDVRERHDGPDDERAAAGAYGESAVDRGRDRRRPRPRGYSGAAAPAGERGAVHARGAVRIAGGPRHRLLGTVLDSLCADRRRARDVHGRAYFFFSRARTRSGSNPWPTR